MFRRRQLGGKSLALDAGWLRALINSTQQPAPPGGGADHGTLSGLADDDHDQYTRGVPINVSATSSNTEGANHTHGVTASANPGVTASLLKTNASGELTLAGDFGVDTDTIYVDVDEDSVYINASPVPTYTGALVVRPSVIGQKGLVLWALSGQTADVWETRDSAGNLLIVLTNDGDLESGNPAFASGISGWQLTPDGDAEFNNVKVRGSIKASVFEYGDIQATAGSVIIAKSAAKLHTDWTSPSSLLDGSNTNTMQVTNDTSGTPLFATNDLLRIKTLQTTGIAQVWLEVQSVTDQGDYSNCSVMLKSGDTSTLFRKGTGIADYGSFLDDPGVIYLSADGIIGESANISITDFDTSVVRVISVGAGGSSYTQDDILTVVQSGAGGCTVRVLTVGGGGEVLTASLVTGGEGYDLKDGNATTGGTGSGCTIDIDALDGPWNNREYLKVRIGNMRGSFGTGSNDRYGFGVGDYSGGNYLSYNANVLDEFILKTGDGNIKLDPAGIGITVATSEDPIQQIKWTNVAETIKFFWLEAYDTGTNTFIIQTTDSALDRDINWINSARGKTGTETIWSARAFSGVEYGGLGLWADDSYAVGTRSQVRFYADLIFAYGDLIIDSDEHLYAGGFVRISGSGNPAAGIGLELEWTGTEGDIRAYDRDSTAYKPLRLSGSKIELREGGTTLLTIDANDVYTEDWTDYSGSSVINGWSSFTTKIINYKRVGKIVWVEFRITGPGSGTTVNFTLPHSCKTAMRHVFAIGRARDNGSWLTGVSYGRTTGGSSTISLVAGQAGGVTGSWSSGTGTRTVEGFFVYAKS